jgi:amino-acid N-acetyltransferase
MNKVPESTFILASGRQREDAIGLLNKNDLPTTDLSGKSLFVLIHDERVIGVGGLEFFGNDALVRSIAVDKEQRGRGLGKYIIKFLEKESMQNGALQVYLLTTTAKDFFASLGYIEVKRDDVPDVIKNSSEFAGVCPSTATVMKKELLA